MELALVGLGALCAVLFYLVYAVAIVDTHRLDAAAREREE